MCERQASAEIESSILFTEVTTEMVDAGFSAEDICDAKGTSRADRIARIYAAMEMTRRCLLAEASEVPSIFPISGEQYHGSRKRGGPFWTVPVYRAR